jgi:hypothetical protein
MRLGGGPLEDPMVSPEPWFGVGLIGVGCEPEKGTKGLLVHSQTPPQRMPADAAAIHWASVGSSRPAQLHQACASCRQTWQMGWVASPTAHCPPTRQKIRSPCRRECSGPAAACLVFQAQPWSDHSDSRS